MTKAEERLERLKPEPGIDYSTTGPDVAYHKKMSNALFFSSILLLLGLLFIYVLLDIRKSASSGKHSSNQVNWHQITRHPRVAKLGRNGKRDNNRKYDDTKGDLNLFAPLDRSDKCERSNTGDREAKLILLANEDLKPGMGMCLDC